MHTFATWLNSLFIVFQLCILVRILMSWVTIAPMRRWSQAVVQFFHDTTSWYLDLFRRMIPPVGPLDLSPMVALIVLFIVQRTVIGLIG